MYLKTNQQFKNLFYKSMLVSKIDYIKLGKEICNKNQFFYTLSILLKCY